MTWFNPGKWLLYAPLLMLPAPLSVITALPEATLPGWSGFKNGSKPREN